MTTLELGPLMSAVLDAQHRQHDALSYPAISGYAVAVAQLARARRCDLLWPVDVGAHKLVGAVEVLTCGGIDVRSYATDASGRRVLLVATVAVSGADLAREAAIVRAAGAVAVHGCAIDSRCDAPDLDSITLLTTDAASVVRSA